MLPDCWVTVKLHNQDNVELAKNINKSIENNRNPRNRTTHL